MRAGHSFTIAKSFNILPSYTGQATGRGHTTTSDAHASSSAQPPPPYGEDTIEAQTAPQAPTAAHTVPERFVLDPQRLQQTLNTAAERAPRYTRHPSVRRKAGHRGALIGAVVVGVGGPAATCFAIFGPGKYRFQGGYIAGKGLGYVIVGAIVGGIIVGSILGWLAGQAGGAIVDGSRQAVDEIDHAAHELNDRIHHRQPDAAHLV